MKAPPIKIGSVILFVAIAMPVVLLAFFLSSLRETFKDEGKPVVGATSNVHSPDMHWVATMETVDNVARFRGLSIEYQPRP